MHSGCGRPGLSPPEVGCLRRSHCDCIPTPKKTAKLLREFDSTSSKSKKNGANLKVEGGGEGEGERWKGGEEKGGGLNF